MSGKTYWATKIGAELSDLVIFSIFSSDIIVDYHYKTQDMFSFAPKQSLVRIMIITW